MKTIKKSFTVPNFKIPDPHKNDVNAIFKLNPPSVVSAGELKINYRTVFVICTAGYVIFLNTVHFFHTGPKAAYSMTVFFLIEI